MYKEIDEAISIWMSQFLSMNQILCEDILQQKAKLFAYKFGITGFSTSANWLTNFKKRNNLRSYVKSGKAANAPDIDKLNKYWTTIAEKLFEYDLQDIYN
ncbi:19699_t:CDS:1, partial [Rhizophagus irregularis]